MSRSGYSDEYCPLWRGAVESAIRGKRGQALLKEMLAALNAMPEKRLVASALQDEDGEVCALGCLGKARGLDLSKLDSEDPEQVAKAFGVARALVQEIAFENDDFCERDPDSPERRWQYMRRWVERQIKQEAPAP